MLKVDRSTPLESYSELYQIYETRDHNAIPFISKVDELQEIIKEIFKREDCRKHGVVLSVEGTWGSGKTTLMNLALKQFQNINSLIINYDSLFYGNVSEATDIFLDDIFKKIRDTFGVDLKKNSIAKNISPKFEISNGLPRFGVDFNLRDRSPTELIKEKLAGKLKNIDGKIIVIIDDLDRVSGDHVVHFLRIVRVLRELPNFIVILPIDKKALEDLLTGNQVANPRKYLEKIIDWSISVDPDINNAKNLFSKKIGTNIESPVDPSSLEELWRMILLELTIHTLETDEVRNLSVNIGTPKADPSAVQYERKAKSTAAGGASLMRAFLERTNTQYNASINLVTKVINSNTPNKRYFRSYVTLYNGQNFVDLLRGVATPQLSPTEQLEDETKNIIRTQWWRDTEYLTSFNTNTQDQNYEVTFPNPPDNTNAEINNRLNETSTTIWNEIRNIVETYYPYSGLTFLAPRSINKIVVALNYDRLTVLLRDPISDTDRQMELYTQVRDAVNKALKEE